MRKNNDDSMVDTLPFDTTEQGNFETDTSGKEESSAIKPKNKRKKKKSVKEEFDFHIYADGSCSHNPGGTGGYGIVIIDKKTGKIYEDAGAYRSTTNNRMEIMGPIKALEKVKILYPSQKFNIQMYSDSQYFIRIAKGEYNARKNLDLWQSYYAISKNFSITYQWVKGHNGDKNNERCDQLALLAQQNGTLWVDEGYAASEQIPTKKKSKKQKDVKSGSMAVKISVPSRLRTEFPYDNVMDYIDNNKLNPLGAETVVNFIKSNKDRFTDFKELRTGGMDIWSTTSKEKLIEALSWDAYDLCVSYLSDEKDVISAMRWHKRGLPLEYAIRKALVDREIADNFTKK